MLNDATTGIGSAALASVEKRPLAARAARPKIFRVVRFMDFQSAKIISLPGAGV
jgi:hypothetical protein